jgi:hypothetical protein
MRIASTGNVGIGTTSPVSGARLDVNGNIQTTTGSGGTLTLYDANLSVNQRVIIGSDATGSYLDSTYGSGGTGVLIFKTIGTEKMRLAQNGNVGIGTTSPSGLLDVVGQTRVGGGSSADALVVRGRTSDDLGFILLANSGGGTAYAYIGTPAANQLAFYTNGFAERMRITSTGNVGIGTTTPDVFGRGYSGCVVGISSAGQSVIELNSATGSAAYFDMGVNGTRILSLYADATSTSLTTTGAQTMNIATTGASILSFGTNNTTRMTIDSGGNITPGADNTQNFGSASLRWATIFANGVTISSATAMLTSSVAMNNGAAAAAGTLLNAPAAGDPTKWIPFNDNGTTRYIPAW